MKRYYITPYLYWFVSLVATQAQSRTSTDSLDIMLGQMICTGIGDLQHIEGHEAIIAATLDQQIGGIILYEKNIAAKQGALALRRLIAAFQLAAKTPLWIAIDEEGGKVNRLRPQYGFITTLSAEDLGHKDSAHTGTQAARIAKQLRELGINLNFAPVVDLAINPKNVVIVQAGRSFGKNEKQVTAHASAFIRAHQKEGITPVLKHFPGHGSSDEDTHIGTADVTETWHIKELFPYKQLMKEGIVSAIMSAHIVNGSLDPEKHPATLSKPIINGLLRNIMGYEGLVFSDDLHMQAVIAHYTLEEAIFRALDAGVDVLLFSQNLPQVEQQSPAELHTLVKRLVQGGRITRSRIQTSYQRIMAHKQRTIMDKH